MAVGRPNYSQLPEDRKVYFLASGGRDSTAMILEAYRLGIEGVMLCADTWYNKKTARDALKETAEYTGFELIFAKYQRHRTEGKERPGEIIKDAFEHLPKAIEWLRTTDKKGYRKNLFHCCGKLKHGPMDEVLKSQKSEDVIRVMGIKGGDGSFWRRYWLGKLRDKGVFWRDMYDGYMYYYPLRDSKKSDINFILKEHDFDHVKSSGCGLCPVFVLFPSMRKADPEVWARSIRYADSLGIEHKMSGQTQLTDYCPDLIINLKKAQKELDKEAMAFK